jgi:hypothetical protein
MRPTIWATELWNDRSLAAGKQVGPRLIPYSDGVVAGPTGGPSGAPIIAARNTALARSRVCIDQQ